MIRKKIELDKAFDVTRTLLQDDKMNPFNNPEQRKVKEKIIKKCLWKQKTLKKISIKITDLKETTPENWNPASSIEVHQLEDISSSLGKG